MADKKISQLAEASTLTDGDTLPVVQSSATKKTLLSTIANHVLNVFTMSLGSVTRTVKSAIDTIVGDISTLNSSVTTINGTLTTLRADVDNITYGNGTRIPANSDLNDYMTAGAYYAGTAADAQSLTNCPTTTSFRLEVKYTANSIRLHQILYCNSAAGVIYFRTYTGSWNGWSQVTTTAVT